MASRKSTYLTKTRYVNGLACAKWLWLDFNAPDKLPKPDPSAQFLLDQGRRVGELARARYPGGELIAPAGPTENDRRSRELLERRAPLFEAGFIHPDRSCYARADVLVPVGRDRWDVVEVKSAGGVKEEHPHDVAFQRYCYSAAGLKIRQCHLLHINTKYERRGEVDPAQLFQEVDITGAVNEITPTVGPHIADLLQVANARDCPEFGRGEPFHKDEAGVHTDDTVWKEHPGSDILGLYHAGKRALEFLEAGVYRISDIPKSVSLKGNQAIQHAAHLTGRIHVDRAEVAAFLAKLRYPLYFLDFETFGTAVPLCDRARPYQQIPFEFSIHVVKAPNGDPKHYSFISLEAEDPRSGLLDSLRKAIGPAGHVVAYNQGFEKAILTDLATFLPEHSEWVEEVSRRFVDLMAPFRSFAYYSPAQGGSASLKAVLPAVTGRGYEGFEIANGGQASLAYLHSVFGQFDGKRAAPFEVEETRKALERYCGRDTEGMVRIVEKLTELTSLAG